MCMYTAGFLAFNLGQHLAIGCAFSSLYAMFSQASNKVHVHVLVILKKTITM